MVRIRRLFPLNWIQWVTLFLLVTVAVGFAYGFSRIETTLRIIHGIQCDAKINNAANLRAGIEYLQEHPNGTPDFSRKFILHAIQQDRAKALTFRNLDCH